MLAVTPYRVLDALGRVRLQGTAEAGAAAIDVSGLRPGVYYLELRTGAGRVARTFSKE